MDLAPQPRRRRDRDRRADRRSHRVARRDPRPAAGRRHLPRHRDFRRQHRDSRGPGARHPDADRGARSRRRNGCHPRSPCVFAGCDRRPIRLAGHADGGLLPGSEAARSPHGPVAGDGDGCRGHGRFAPSRHPRSRFHPHVRRDGGAARGRQAGAGAPAEATRAGVAGRLARGVCCRGGRAAAGIGADVFTGDQCRTAAESGRGADDGRCPGGWDRGGGARLVRGARGGVRLGGGCGGHRARRKRAPRRCRARAGTARPAAGRAARCCLLRGAAGRC